MFYAYRQLLLLFLNLPQVSRYQSHIVDPLDIHKMQAMIIVAWNGSGKLSGIFDGDVFKKVLSVFITAAVLKLAQGTQLVEH